jgi:hypothetical protein
MSQAPKPQPTPVSTPTPTPVDPYPPYRRVYAWLFQAWLIMFLGVICCALVFYLLSYLPRP